MTRALLALTAAVLLLLTLAAACGAGTDDEPAGADRPDVSPPPLALETPETAGGEAEATERYQECISRAGYVVAEVEPGQSLPLTRSFIEFRNDLEQCEVESGLMEIREARGLAPSAPGDAVKSWNLSQQRLFLCVESRGWEIAPPTSDPSGLEYYFLDALPPEEQAQRARDISRCYDDLQSRP